MTGFSLLELLVVMSVTLLLTGLMLPALVQLRENAHRVVCSSNQRQIGYAMVIYADEHNGNLPPSFYGLPGQSKQEMMAAHRGHSADNWEGFGWLYARFYLNAPEIFYCPSHTGHHPFERYEVLWRFPGIPRIYTNYHYAGPVDWDNGKRRRLEQGRSLVLATDGLRSIRDFNHRTGMNVLYGDGSVTWRDDISREVIKMLAGEDTEVNNDDDVYARIWNILGGPAD